MKLFMSTFDHRSPDQTYLVIEIKMIWEISYREVKFWDLDVGGTNANGMPFAFGD